MACVYVHSGVRACPFMMAPARRPFIRIRIKEGTVNRVARCFCCAAVYTQSNPVQSSAAQRSTAQRSAAQHITAQHSAAHCHRERSVSFLPSFAKATMAWSLNGRSAAASFTPQGGASNFNRSCGSGRSSASSHVTQAHPQLSLQPAVPPQLPQPPPLSHAFNVSHSFNSFNRPQRQKFIPFSAVLRCRSSQDAGTGRRAACC
jgi:hypothetical protein